MIKFNQIAEIESNAYAEMLLSDYEIGDAITYYFDSIIEEYAKTKEQQEEGFYPSFASSDYIPKFSDEEKDIVINYLLDNAADLLSITYGIYGVKGQITLASIEEIEIDLSNYHWTDKRADIVSRKSDIYVKHSSHGTYGYVNVNCMRLEIKINPIYIDAALEEAKEEG